MKKPSFEKYVSKHDRIINESAVPVAKRTVTPFNLEMAEDNLNEWSWPFSRADTHKEANKTKQTETDLKNLFAYFKAVNYNKHPKLKESAFAWLKATKDVLAAIQAERSSYNANAKTQVMSGSTATPPNAAPKPQPTKNPLMGSPGHSPLLAAAGERMAGRQKQ